ncbi:polysaccharide deacetylase [Methylocystis sp. JAN1]|uniref:polysaccharide deacetylase n=1 Tax=Methylocystis sp. JAN1 TaxID=3397211 RepID=UPI003FA25C0F
MSALLTPIERCKEVAGLEPHEIVLGVSPSEKHERLLAKYRRARRSQALTRARIVADIRAAVAAGATREAADLLIVLRRLLALAAPRAPRRGRSACSRRPALVLRARWARRLSAETARAGAEPDGPEAAVLRLPAREKSP